MGNIFWLIVLVLGTIYFLNNKSIKHNIFSWFACIFIVALGIMILNILIGGVFKTIWFFVKMCVLITICIALVKAISDKN